MVDIASSVLLYQAEGTKREILFTPRAVLKQSSCVLSVAPKTEKCPRRLIMDQNDES